MKNILYIDCLIRNEKSRTKLIADAFFGALDTSRFAVTHLILNDEGLLPLDSERLARRDALISGSNLDNEMFRYAHQFASADVVVIAAPFWDLSFPAMLKIYIENISVQNVTFGYGDNGLVGLCRGKHLVFLTSRGGLYTNSDMEHGDAYIKSLKTFFGFDEYTCVAADGLDICGFDIEAILADACEKAVETAHYISR